MFQFARAAQLFCRPTVVGGTAKRGVAHAFVEVAATVLFQCGPHASEKRGSRVGRLWINTEHNYLSNVKKLL